MLECRRDAAPAPNKLPKPEQALALSAHSAGLATNSYILLYVKLTMGRPSAMRECETYLVEEVVLTQISKTAA